jgi:hypothetical protein
VQPCEVALKQTLVLLDRKLRYHMRESAPHVMLYTEVLFISS